MAWFVQRHSDMSPKTLPRTAALPAWAPYVAPFALFLILTSLEGQFANQYPLFYTAKILLVGGLLLALRRTYAEFKGNTRGLPLALGLGAVLTLVWVWGDQHTPHFAFLGARQGFNPITTLPDLPQRMAFLAVRFLGLVVVVPVMEELFYRGFLLRFVTDPDDFRRVQTGTFTPAALAVNVVLMAASHPEWLVAAVFSAAMCLLLARTRSLTACIVAHGVTNLLLGLYVLTTHTWFLW